MTVKIYVRDPDLNRVGELDDFQSITAVPKFNDVGTWELSLDARVPTAAMLLQPQYGIALTYDGVQVISGPVRGCKIERRGKGRTLTVTGWSDDVWLKRRIAHMQPDYPTPPYSVNEHDVRTDVASQVIREYVDANLGPASLPARRVPNLTIRADPPMGSTITGRARLQVLIEFLAELALSGGGLGFQLVQVGTGLEFQTYTPTDLSQSVKFSEQLGNLGDFSYEFESPEANYIFCGGGGEGTARTFVEGADGDSVVEWGRIEEFRDRRDTTDTGEMQQTITEELAEKAGPVALSIQPLDTPTQRYGVNYTLGDKVTVTIEGQEIVEQIRQVTLTYDPDGPLNVVSDIGTPGRQSIFRIFKAVRDLGTRITNIERR